MTDRPSVPPALELVFLARVRAKSDAKHNPHRLVPHLKSQTHHTILTTKQYKIKPASHEFGPLKPSRAAPAQRPDPLSPTLGH